MTNFLIFRYAASLHASKNVDYREQTRLWVSIFIKFLQENNLTTRCLVSDVNNIPENLITLPSSMDEDGNKG